jgi:hypothetical protein
MSGALLETQLARSWLPSGLGNRRAGTENESCSGWGGVLSSLRGLLVRSCAGGGDSVVLRVSKPFPLGRYSLVEMWSVPMVAVQVRSWFGFLPVWRAKLP